MNVRVIVVSKFKTMIKRASQPLKSSKETKISKTDCNSGKQTRQRKVEDAYGKPNDTNR